MFSVILQHETNTTIENEVAGKTDSKFDVIDSKNLKEIPEKDVRSLLETLFVIF